MVIMPNDVIAARDGITSYSPSGEMTEPQRLYRGKGEGFAIGSMGENACVCMSRRETDWRQTKNDGSKFE